jgi:hypothetical protein
MATSFSPLSCKILTSDVTRRQAAPFIIENQVRRKKEGRQAVLTGGETGKGRVGGISHGCDHKKETFEKMYKFKKR